MSKDHGCDVSLGIETFVNSVTNLLVPALIELGGRSYLSTNWATTWTQRDSVLLESLHRCDLPSLEHSLDPTLIWYWGPFAASARITVAGWLERDLNTSHYFITSLDLTVTCCKQLLPVFCVTEDESPNRFPSSFYYDFWCAVRNLYLNVFIYRQYVCERWVEREYGLFDSFL